MSYRKKFFSGNSIEQAVLQAARHFELETTELAYRKVERRHGFLKTRRRAVIEVDADNPRIQREAAHEGVVPESAEPERVDRESENPQAEARVEALAPARSPEKAVGDRADEQKGDEPSLTSLPDFPGGPDKKFDKAEGELAEAAQEAIGRLLRLGRVEVEADVYQGDGGLEVEIHGKDEEAFLEDRGRLLLAMQHLLPRLLRGLTGETVPCRVDCDNFQEIRAEQLRVLAQKVATEVRENRRSRTLEPMSPDERRIIHMTLADDSAVETESQGSGLFKRVMVMPARSRPRGLDPYN
jgi:spoIIIJ-associated protein